MALDTVNALVSLADAKAFLKISAASEDTVIENMINRASAFANDYTQRLLLSRVNTDYYDGDGTGTLILNQYPVTALSNLYDDVDRAFGAGTAINVSTDVVLDNNNGLIMAVWRNCIRHTNYPCIRWSKQENSSIWNKWNKLFPK